MPSPFPGPAIPIPLLPPDGDLWIDLATVFATSYARGRYERSVTYEAAPPVALDAARLAWVAAQARGAPWENGDVP